MARESERAGAPRPLACVPVCLSMSMSERRLHVCVSSFSCVWLYEDLCPLRKELTLCKICE